MVDTRTRPTLIGDAPPEGARHRRSRRRVGSIFALASALAVGFAVLAAPQSAEAVTNLDGPWTVVHGGTGQLSLNADGTYTSTCKAYPNYPDAWCPAPSGTFERDSLGSSNVTFHGADGSTTSYRYSGLVSSPDTIDSTFSSPTYSQLEMKKGTTFVCTEWGDNGYRMKGSPLVSLDASTNLLYATGSHDQLGVATADTQVTLAETAPNYFQDGTCAEFAPPPDPATVMRAGNVRDLSVINTTSPWPMWTPAATVTVTDLTGALVSGATANLSFDGSYSATCVTAADGTCTVVSGTSLYAAYPDSGVTVGLITKDGLTWDGQFVWTALHEPNVPTPATVHIGDLDNATNSLSSLKAAPSRSWQPRVDATVVDASGVGVAGATVTGTFSHHQGAVTCVTAANGICTLGNVSIGRSTRSTVFSVTGVVKTGSTYAPASNSDPDGDSNGTAITVNRP